MPSKFVASALIAALIVHVAVPTQIHFRGGLLAPHEPKQRVLGESASSWEYEGFEIVPLATWESEVRVLSSKHYWFGKQSQLSPVDLAVGWGPMSNRDVFSKLSIRQGMRFYFWSARELPIPADDIVRHSSNFHLIPASNPIRDKLLRLEADDVVYLRGFLVSVSDDSGWHWQSSLSREDSGNGACELIWVEEAIRS